MEILRSPLRDDLKSELEKPDWEPSLLSPQECLGNLQGVVTLFSPHRKQPAASTVQSSPLYLYFFQ